ncbi:MAG: hypothetical protein SOI56_07805 [Eubacteriales bacterium]|jgi:hypothetical protein
MDYSEKEKKILSVLETEPEERFADVTWEKADPDLLYELSPWRAGLTSWLPISASDSVLEMQAGYGALTAGLADRAGTVVCLERTPEQYQINSLRQRDRKNVECGLWEVSGGDEEIQKFLEEKYQKSEDNARKFDWVILYIPNSALSLRSELELAEVFTGENGHVVVAVDNKTGLRSRNGGGIPHGAMSKKGLERIFEELGWSADFYYPYPSLEFTESIYSDRFLPRPEELSSYRQSFYKARLCWFDEQEEYADALENHFYPLVANSYLCILTRKKAEAEKADNEHAGKGPARFPIYVKYSNQRNITCNTVTSVYEDSDGKRSVEKRAFNKESRPFVAGISDKYLKLSGAFTGTKMQMNRCERSTDKISLEYLTGRSLDTVIDGYLEDGRTDLAEKVIDEYWARVLSAHPHETFTPTHEFRDVFGDNIVKGEEDSLSVTNIDMIFANILVPEVSSPEDSDKKEVKPGTEEAASENGDTEGAEASAETSDGDDNVEAAPETGDTDDTTADKSENSQLPGVRQEDKWDVIDYEWTFDFPIPVKFVMYRALFYYAHYRPGRESFVSGLYEKYGIDAETKEVFRLMEDSFQRWIMGSTKPIRDHFAKYGKPDIQAADLYSEVTDTQSDLTEMRAKVANLEADKRRLQDELGRLQLKSNDDDQQIAGLTKNCEELQAELNGMRHSFAWRLTAPLRAIRNFFRRVFRKENRKEEKTEEKKED